MSKNSVTPKRYRFTGDFPVIFTDLEIGKNVTVERAQPNVDYTGQTIEASTGSTLVLRTGDIITPTADSYEHAWLVEVDPDGKPITSAEPDAEPDAVTPVDTTPVSTDPSAIVEGTNLDKKDDE